jgi:hypothetical protein
MEANPYRAPAVEADAPGVLPHFRSLQGVQALLTPLLVSWGLMDLSAAVISFVQPAQFDENAELTGSELLGLGVYLIYMLVILATIITFGTLLVRSNHNARSFGGIVKFSPASMVWWYFVPIASLYKPYEAFKTVWQASSGGLDFSEKHPLMPAWWATWLAANILGNISWRLPDSASATFSLVTAPVTIASCFFAIVVTRALSERQEATALALRTVQPSPSFAPA